MPVCNSTVSSSERALYFHFMSNKISNDGNSIGDVNFPKAGASIIVGIQVRRSLFYKKTWILENSYSIFSTSFFILVFFFFQIFDSHAIRNGILCPFRPPKETKQGSLRHSTNCMRKLDVSPLLSFSRDLIRCVTLPLGKQTHQQNRIKIIFRYIGDLLRL